jgi:hypothetical protein
MARKYPKRVGKPRGFYKPSKANISGITGIVWDKANRKFRLTIKEEYWGLFNTIEDCLSVIAQTNEYNKLKEENK